jgi:hypothetical protein
MAPLPHKVRAAANHVPLALLAMAPLFDLVRLVTHEPSWSRLAFGVGFVAAVTAAVVVLPELVDGLAHARRAAALSLALRAGGVGLFGSSVVARLRSGTLAPAALSFGLAVAGALAFAVGAAPTSRRACRRAARRATAPAA